MSPLWTACLVSFKRAILISVVIITHVTIINWLVIFAQKGHTYLCRNYRSCHCYQLLVQFHSRGHTYHCSNCRLLLSTAYPVSFKRAINISVAYYSYYIDHVTCINCLLNFIPESLKLEEIAGADQCGLRCNISNTHQMFCIRQTLRVKRDSSELFTEL